MCCSYVENIRVRDMYVVRTECACVRAVLYMCTYDVCAVYVRHFICVRTMCVRCMYGTLYTLVTCDMYHMCKTIMYIHCTCKSCKSQEKFIR